MGSFRDRLAAAGLGDHAEALEALRRPAIRLLPEAVDESEIAIGASKLGGHPGLPDSFDWPEYDGVPQSFVAQIALSEVHPYDQEGVLPEAGLLSFFYDARQNVWGFDPAEAGAWAVRYTRSSATLTRYEFPDALPEEGRFRARRLNPRAEATAAPADSSHVAALGLAPKEAHAYAETIGSEDGLVHRVLGHPEPIQGDMQLECQLVAHGLYCGDASGYEDPRAQALEPGATDWRLLLQIDSEEDAGMMWGDSGRIYYWMTRDALAGRRWDEAHMILQCY